MKTIYKIHFCLLLSLFSLSCSKWVDVKPTDRLGEDQLFINKEGYLKALNGIYVEMTNAALYGQEMTTGAVDVLAQYYFLSNTQHKYFPYTTFVYTNDNVKITFNNSWKKAYELVANCNVILEKCGDAPSQALPQPYYGLIKGETLALRALFHLDMLRLFGPIYTQADKAKPAIPYVKKTSLEIFPLLGSESVMQEIISDLQASLLLMENTDPIRTEGVRNESNPSGSNDLYYRQYRLNYYATKALLARAYLWQGNKAEALIQAENLLQEVQKPGKIVFPYVTSANVNHATQPDRVFSTEVMFALYDINRIEMHKRLFDVSLPLSTKLSFTVENITETRVNATYDDANDYRRKIWQNVSSGTITALTNMKYADVVNGPGRYMIPMIRISELLLIAAECHPDLATGINYLNKLRIARNAVNLTALTSSALLLQIGKEYRREMLGEGQQFFFYKRNAYLNIPNHNTVPGTPDKAMLLNNYIVPLPESETSQRQ